MSDEQIVPSEADVERADAVANIWLDCKPHFADEVFCSGKYGIMRRTKDAHCTICGHVFEVGDGYRWVYMNGASPSPGNFFVCASCDRPDIAERVRDAIRAVQLHMQPWTLLYQASVDQASDSARLDWLDKKRNVWVGNKRGKPEQWWHFRTRTEGDTSVIARYDSLRDAIDGAIAAAKERG